MTIQAVMDGPPLGGGVQTPQSPQLGTGRGLVVQNARAPGGTPPSRERLEHLKYSTGPSNKKVASIFDSKSYPKNLRVHLTSSEDSFLVKLLSR
eukprot:TRINITY_DN1930_c0_g1_i1.p1 TRINITY_DN1930_c0_g1~~TRINITY_DN1930_c0_g1_i1.p1  ORF type:complete len:94 (+),score=11.88 TRINITY_DN1930_c0_g1_i1:213-494(+)